MSEEKYSTTLEELRVAFDKLRGDLVLVYIDTIKKLQEMESKTNE